MTNANESIHCCINKDGEFIEGLSKRELFATNAQKAIIGNADTLREITKAVNYHKLEDREGAFYRTVSAIAVDHADALIEALNHNTNAGNVKPL